MIRRRRFITHSIILAAIVSSLGWPGPTRAEVSAQGDDSNAGAKVVVVLLGITEDGEPVNSWRVQGGSAPERQVLNAEGDVRGDGPPAILIHPQSRIGIAAWSRNSESGFDVVVSRFEAGEWSDPAVVADGPGNALDPALAVDPESGIVHVLYWLDDGASRVLHRAAPADLSSWSDPVLVSQPGEIAARPSAVVHAGRLLVAYESYPTVLGSTPRQIVVAERSDGVWLSETLAGSDFDGANAPQIHRRSTGIWVDWLDAADEMRWSRRSDGGSWTSLAVEPFEGAEDRELHVRGRVRAAERTLE